MSAVATQHASPRATRFIRAATPNVASRKQIKAAMNRHFTADGWVGVTVGPSVAQLPLPKVMVPETTMAQSCMPAIR